MDLCRPRVFGRKPQPDEPGPRLSPRTVLVEWLVLTAAVLVFCARFLDLGTGRPLVGNEAEFYLITDWVLLHSLAEYGQFPLWNPYLRTGWPFAAEPFLHIYNPLISIPIFSFGVLDGFKVALFLGFLTAALGMWWLGLELGLGGPARLWVALMFAFSGPGPAKFVQGQYLWIIGPAWIPAVLAGLISTSRSGRRLHAGLAVLSIALLFFSGQMYYAYFTLFMILLYVAVVLLPRRRDWESVVQSLEHAKRFGVIALLSLGLVAVQLLPFLELSPIVVKSRDPEFVGSHTLSQIWFDYTARELRRPDTLPTIGPVPPEQYYAYIGIWPFLALVLLPLVIWQRSRSLVAFFLLLILLVVLWVDVREMPWRDFFAHVYPFNQFRHPTLMLIFGVLAVVALAGLGLDTLFKLLLACGRDHPSTARGAIRWGGGVVGASALSLFLIWSVADVFAQNRPLLQTHESDRASYQVGAWLRDYDSGVYLTGASANWYGALLTNELRHLEVWLAPEITHPPSQRSHDRRVQPRPNYLILHREDPMGADERVLVGQVDPYMVYYLPRSLPFAFTVENSRLSSAWGRDNLESSDVLRATPLVRPNDIEVIAEGSPNTTLVVLTTALPGWRVHVDGRERLLRNLDGYLAADLEPGIHRYVFSYSLSSFWIGLGLTLVSLAATLWLLLSDLRLQPAPSLAWLRTRRATAVAWPARIRPFPHVARLLTLEWALFSLAVLVYLMSRFWALEEYPIYFFSDEALNAIYAEELVARGLRHWEGDLLPVYFEVAAGRWAPLLSVYVHMIPVLLFGKSIFVTRATTAVVSVFGVVAAALVLKLIFRVRFWWSGILLAGLAPAWFLHSRTAFETAMQASFYACFLLCYLLYRTRSTRFLLPAVVFAAAAFYTYSNGQAVVAALGALLLLSDLRFHLRHWRAVGPALGLSLVLLVPFVHFQIQHAGAIETHLQTIGSYLSTPIPVEQKALKFLQNYALGLSPNYWFLPNTHDLARHRMLGQAHLPQFLLPLVALGAGLCIWRVRSSPHRTLLLAALVTPAGAALAEIGITRVLSFVLPAVILAVLGLQFLLDRLTPMRATNVIGVSLLAMLGLGSLAMLRQATVEGPLWFRDYGLYGMQYGARQVFQETVPRYLDNSTTRVFVSPTWANGTEHFPRYFLRPDQRRRVELAGTDYFLSSRRNLGRDAVVVIPPDEYEKARTSPKLKSVDVEEIIPHPDGTPGFYVVRLEYAENVEAILQAEREARRQLVGGDTIIDGRAVRVTHSQVNHGTLRDMFDGDRNSFVRGIEANPFVVELSFAEPTRLVAIDGEIALRDLQWTARLYEPGADTPITYAQTYRNLAGEPRVEMSFDRGPALVSRLRLEIENLTSGSTAEIHVRELRLQEHER